MFCLLVRYRTLCFAYWSGTERFVLLIGAVQNALFCLIVLFSNLKLLVPKLGTTGYHCKLKLLIPHLGTSYHCKETAGFLEIGTPGSQPSKPEVTIARNCQFPEIGTPGCEPWNHRLPLQGTAGSQRLELLVPNLGTIDYHCKELPVPRDWKLLHCCQPWNHRLPLQGTPGSQRLELLVANLGFIVYHCKETAGSQRLELLGSQPWKLWVTIARKCPVLFCLLVRYTTLCFADWSGTQRFVLLIGPVHERFVLLNGPVQDVLF